jgi:hypothetical protein
MLFLLKIESVFVIVYSLYYFYEGVLFILGNIAEIFLGFGITGILLALFGFYIIFIYCRVLPTDFVFVSIYFLD